MSQGTKFDNGKPMLALIPARAIIEVGKVMSYGAKKYGSHNYLGGISHLRLLSAALRHTWAYISGEDNDIESGLPHWAHACACFLMLGEMIVEHPSLDDRFKPVKEESTPCNHEKLIAKYDPKSFDQIGVFCDICGDKMPPYLKEAR